jgi:molybdopterin converting factor small subunit
MAFIWIPALMRDLTNGQAQVEIDGLTVGDVIDHLDLLYPGVKKRLCTGEKLVPNIVAYVDGKRALLGLSQPVEQDSEIHFMPLASGG